MLWSEQDEQMTLPSSHIEVQPVLRAVHWRGAQKGLKRNYVFKNRMMTKTPQKICLPWSPKVRKSVEVGSLFRKKMVITWDYEVKKFFKDLLTIFISAKIWFREENWIVTKVYVGLLLPFIVTKCYVVVLFYHTHTFLFRPHPWFSESLSVAHLML